MNPTQRNVLYLAALSNMALGGFLIVDSLFLHTLTFQYSFFGLMPSPYFHHAIIGVVFVFFGISLYWIAASGRDSE